MEAFDRSSVSADGIEFRDLPRMVALADVPAYEVAHGTMQYARYRDAAFVFTAAKELSDVLEVPESSGVQEIDAAVLALGEPAHGHALPIFFDAEEFARSKAKRGVVDAAAVAAAAAPGAQPYVPYQFQPNTPPRLAVESIAKRHVLLSEAELVTAGRTGSFCLERIELKAG